MPFINITREHKRIILLCLGVLVVLAVMCMFRSGRYFVSKPEGTYSSLSPDTSTGNPLEFIGKDYSVQEGFVSNLPIVIIGLDAELPDYKEFDGQFDEVQLQSNAYTTGDIRIISGDGNLNSINDEPSYTSKIRIKMRGHSSYRYDKKQYKFKALLPDGNDNETSILGMGQGSEWILNGSLADKSLIRNYLAYRTASEVGGNNFAVDSRFCEVVMDEDGKLVYQGVYLLMETVSRGRDRVNIDSYNPKNIYSSYIVRRDRFTHFDIMLDTYGRRTGVDKSTENGRDGYIGLKYPSASRVTDETVKYIGNDFSAVEKVLYSKDFNVYSEYPNVIDVDSFVDFFIFNEFFNNYDSGLRSTYMYKNSGDKLFIGPVWDFDSAMDNTKNQETEDFSLAFQTEPLYIELFQDKEFIRKIKNRYNQLRSGALAEEHVFAIVDEAFNYLKSAQARDFYRWQEQYMTSEGQDNSRYILEPYEIDGVVFNRFNTNYAQEMIVIKNYLHKHGSYIQEDLDSFIDLAQIDTRNKNIREFWFVAIMTLFLAPSYLIMRKG